MIDARTKGDMIFKYRKIKLSMDTVSRMVIEVHDDRNKKDFEDILIGHRFKIRYQNKIEIVKRTFRNIAFHPLSFIEYDRLNEFYASRVFLKFPLTGKSRIPFCGETQGLHLLETWK